MLMGVPFVGTRPDGAAVHPGRDAPRRRDGRHPGVGPVGDVVVVLAELAGGARTAHPDRTRMLIMSHLGRGRVRPGADTSRDR